MQSACISFAAAMQTTAEPKIEKLTCNFRRQLQNGIILQFACQAWHVYSPVLNIQAFKKPFHFSEFFSILTMHHRCHRYRFAGRYRSLERAHYFGIAACAPKGLVTPLHPVDTELYFINI